MYVYLIKAQIEVLLGSGSEDEWLTKALLIGS